MGTKARGPAPSRAGSRRHVVAASPGEPARTRRGRPPRIDRDHIVRAALDVGLETASMQAIAARLGVTTPALYGHVAGLGHVRELAAARLLGDLAVPSTDDWREWLRAFGRRARHDLGAAGAALRVDLRGPLGLRRLAVAEDGLALLIRAGFRPADAGRAVWLVARVATTAGPASAASVRGPIREAQRVSGGVSGSPSPARRRYPAMARAIAQLTRPPAVDTLEFDLGVVICGLERELARTRRRAAATKIPTSTAAS